MISQKFPVRVNSDRDFFVSATKNCRPLQKFCKERQCFLFIFILTRFRVYFFFLRVTVKAAPANETAATLPITIAPTLKSAVWVGVGMPPVLPAATTAVVVTTGVAGCVTGNVVAIVV